MSNKYKKWINKHYPTYQTSFNKCNEAVRLMVEEFEELTIQVGYANGVYHCWTRDKDNNIIDPTANQFKQRINYALIAERFLKKHEIELSTGAVFLDELYEGVGE